MHAPHRRPTSPGVLIAAALMLAVASASMAQPRASFQRGVTISCWGWGAEWQSPGMAQAMDDIKALGGNAISFHPYAWIGNDGEVKDRRPAQDPTVLTPLAMARERGLTVLHKPHIGYWGSRFDWRGAIGFESDAEWRRFFESYERFIVRQARMAQRGGAAIFCVGVEYKKTLSREREWRKIIAAVRAVFKGRLTYAANWDSYQRVGFWDALDLIGIQAYFPLSELPAPDRAALEAGWDKVYTRLEAFSLKHGKRLLFTELGYNRSSRAASEPWDHRQGGEGARALKLLCLSVALERAERCEALAGVYLWKWFPSRQRKPRDFRLQEPEVFSRLAALWRPRPGGDGAPTPPTSRPAEPHAPGDQRPPR